MSWPLVAIGDVAEILSGNAWKSSQFTNESEGRLPIIRIQNISDVATDFIYWDGVALEKYIIKDGDLLLSLSGNVKLCEWSFGNALLNQRIVKLAPTACVDKRYFYWALHRVVAEIEAMARHAVIANVSVTDLKEFQIPLPPLSEQKRIAVILDKADAIRRKRQQAIQFADDFLRAVFLDMFGDPVTNPKGWEVKLLKDLSLKIHSGNTPKGGKENYVESGVVFLRSQNVWKRKIILDDVAYIDSATHKKMAGSSLRNQDILMTKTGRFNTENSSLGRAAMFCGEDDSANVNGHVYLIRLGEKVDKKFVLFILTMSEYYEYIRSVCVGGIDKRQLNKEHLENFPIIFPSAEMQRKFSGVMDMVENVQAKAANALQGAETMFDALSQKAFSGQL